MAQIKCRREVAVRCLLLANVFCSRKQVLHYASSLVSKISSPVFALFSKIQISAASQPISKSIASCCRR